MKYKSGIANKSFELELQQIDIPYDVIIVRKSIINYNQFRCDKDYSALVGIEWFTDVDTSTLPLRVKVSLKE